MGRSRAALGIVDVFRRTAEADPDRTALLFAGDRVISYGELLARAESLAGRLVRAGASRESVVGICLERTPELVIAMLAVWFARAAFLPLDPKLPKRRLERMLADSGAEGVVASAATRDLFPSSGLYVIDPAEHAEPEDGASALHTAPFSPEDLAYLIYTSGSTGDPKGVLVTHRGLIPLLQAQIEAFRIGPSSRALWILSFGFDASISDVGTALLSRATLVIEPETALASVRDMLAVMRARRITHVDLPPALLPLFDVEDIPDTLETIVIGGEVCPAPIIRRWASRVRLVNVYGPTEATVCTSLCVARPDWDRALIGQPLPGVRYRIVDRDLRDVDRGATGELLIAGQPLARGYHRNRRLEAAKFVEVGGERAFRTGDLVILHEDSEIEFLGRVDRQIKVRGQLVAPEEIEKVLTKHPDVRAAAVVGPPRSTTEPPSVRDRTGLSAYVEIVEGRTTSTSALRLHVENELPAWMVPRSFAIVDKLPTNAHGKIDLARLSERSDSSVRRGRSDPGAGVAEEVRCAPGVPPRDPRAWEEEELHRIFSDVLDVRAVGTDDDLFALGGDSLSILEIVARAERVGIALTPRDLVEHPTIADLAALSRSRAREQGAIADALPAALLRSEAELPSDLAEAIARQIAARRLERQTAAGAGPAPWAREARRSDEPPMHDRIAHGAPAHRPREILLTGGTGFLGSRLILELLERTEAHIHCVVRAESPSRGEDRIRAAIERHVASERILPADRWSIVYGDLTSPDLGLRGATWDRLAQTIDTVYHAGAAVHIVAPYAALRAANVGGTRAILRFVSSGRPKRLHYASTLSVFVSTDQSFGRFEEADALDRDVRVFGGYAQTKWVAERMLHTARRLGLDGVSIYRFGLLTGDSTTGRSSPNDFLARFFEGIVSLGCVPEAALDLAIDVTPIDHAAAAMAHLSLDRDPGTFHIANPKAATMRDVIAAIGTLGHSLQIATADEWSRIAPRSENEAAAHLALCRAWSTERAFERYRTIDLFQATGVSFDQSSTRPHLIRAGLSCPEPSIDLLARCFAAATRVG